jgi:hypothetical protein
MFMIRKLALVPLTLLTLQSSLTLAQQPQWQPPSWPMLQYGSAPQFWHQPMPGQAIPSFIPFFIPFPFSFWFLPTPPAPAFMPVPASVPIPATAPSAAASEASEASKTSKAKDELPITEQAVESIAEISTPIEAAKEVQAVKEAQAVKEVKEVEVVEAVEAVEVVKPSEATTAIQIDPKPEPGPSESLVLPAAGPIAPEIPTNLPEPIANLKPAEAVVIEQTPPSVTKPVAVKKPRISKKPTKKLRKLCWKDGKLDVCP